MRPRSPARSSATRRSSSSRSTASAGASRSCRCGRTTSSSKLDANGNPAPDTAGADNLQQFVDILGSTYGITDAASKYSSFQTTNDVITLFGRVDWNIEPGTTFSLRENFANHNNDNLFNPSFDFSYGLARAEKLADQSSSLVGEFQSVTGDALRSTCCASSISDEDRPRNGHDLRPSLT